MFIVTSAGQAEEVDDYRPFTFEDEEKPPAHRSVMQLGVFGGESHDWEDRKPWDWRAKQAHRWLREPHWLLAEVKTALRRSTGIPGGGYAVKGFPPPTAKQYREWAKGETRPRCMTFYDGKEMIS